MHATVWLQKKIVIFEVLAYWLVVFILFSSESNLLMENFYHFSLEFYRWFLSSCNFSPSIIFLLHTYLTAIIPFLFMIMPYKTKGIKMTMKLIWRPDWIVYHNNFLYTFLVLIIYQPLVLKHKYTTTQLENTDWKPALMQTSRWFKIRELTDEMY